MSERMPSTSPIGTWSSGNEAHRPPTTPDATGSTRRWRQCPKHTPVPGGSSDARGWAGLGGGGGAGAGRGGSTASATPCTHPEAEAGTSCCSWPRRTLLRFLDDNAAGAVSEQGPVGFPFGLLGLGIAVCLPLPSPSAQSPARVRSVPEPWRRWPLATGCLCTTCVSENFTSRAPVWRACVQTWTCVDTARRHTRSAKPDRIAPVACGLHRFAEYGTEGRSYAPFRVSAGCHLPME